MRKEAFVLFLLILASTVLAEETYTQGKSLTVSGHTVTIVNIGENSVIVSVDGTKGIAPLNQEVRINDMHIIVTEIFYTSDVETRYTKADFSATGASASTNNTASGCGDGICGSGEDVATCCDDCGCNKDYSCINNVCAKNECTEDEDCVSDSRDYCKSYKCKGKPKKCIIKPITECTINDLCCPSTCYYPDDPDCDKSKLNQNKPAESKETSLISENESTSDQKPIEEKGTNFISRLISWILGLFKR